MANLLILTVGIPGAGKTTWVEKYIRKHGSTCVVSTDAIRKELTGTAECDESQIQQIHTEARKRARHYLELKRDVVVDATNVDVEEWKAYKEICLPSTLMCAKVFEIDMEKAIRRVQKRGTVEVPRHRFEYKQQLFEASKPFLRKYFCFFF